MRLPVVVFLALASCSSNPKPHVTQAPTPSTVVDQDAGPGSFPAFDKSDWNHWIDSDGDCQDTRQEVLIAASEVSVTFETDKNCVVATGKWICPYTGETFTDPSQLDVVHSVPLSSAHAAGGHAWDAKRKEAYANDTVRDAHLVAVSASANRLKGTHEPSTWLPSINSCDYMMTWLSSSLVYDLRIDEAFLKLHESQCLDKRTAGATTRHKGFPLKREGGRYTYGSISGNAPPPPPLTSPKIVSQLVLEHSRIRGTRKILPPMSVAKAIGAGSKQRIIGVVKLCLDATGKPDTVTLLKSTYYPSYDLKLKNTIRHQWKFRAFRVGGRRVPVCTSVTFIYKKSP